MLTLVISVGFIFFSNFLYRPLNGILQGEIIFKPNAIQINENTFKLADINNPDFSLSDYYGKVLNASVRGDFNPKLSQGVDNRVTFTDKTGQTKVIYFKLATKLHYEDLIPFINEAVKAKKIEFKTAIDLVGIENVSI